MSRLSKALASLFALLCSNVCCNTFDSHTETSTLASCVIHTQAAWLTQSVRPQIQNPICRSACAPGKQPRAPTHQQPGPPLPAQGSPCLCGEASCSCLSSARHNPALPTLPNGGHVPPGGGRSAKYTATVASDSRMRPAREAHCHEICSRRGWRCRCGVMHDATWLLWLLTLSLVPQACAVCANSLAEYAMMLAI